MAEGNKGIHYELEITRILKQPRYSLTPRNFTPAGSDNKSPDGIFLRNGEKYPFEIKLDLRADYGQLNIVKPKDKWIWTPKSTNYESMELFDELKVLDIINKEWPLKPARFSYKGRMSREDKDFDMYNFKDFRVQGVSWESILKHYERKKTYYIQVKGYGFYRLGDTDPAGLKKAFGVPEFKPNVSLRVRVKGKNTSNYAFNTALKINGTIPKSDFDLEKDPMFLRR